MKSALTIAAKDLRQRLRDRSALILAVGAPLTLAIVFSLTAGVASLHGRFDVVDDDHGAIASEFLRGPGAALTAAGIATVNEGVSPGRAQDDVKAGKADAAFVFAAGFSNAINQGQPAELKLLVTDRVTSETLLAGGVARSFLASLERTGLAAETALKVEGLSPSDPRRELLLGAASEMQSKVTIGNDPVELRQTDSKTSSVAHMAVFFIFLTVQFSFLSLHSERAEGTLSRMLAAPIRPRDILLGKALVGFILGMASLTILVLVSIPLLGARWGSPAGVALLMVAVTAAAMGVMGAAATFAKTFEQANSMGTIVAVVLGLLGGSFFPTYLGPEVMARLSLATPHAWWIRGLGDLAPKGAGVRDAVPAAAVLFAFALATGTFALWRARRLVSP